MTLFQIADSLWDFAERMRPVDHRRNLACLDELLQDLQFGRSVSVRRVALFGI